MVAEWNGAVYLCLDDTRPFLLPRSTIATEDLILYDYNASTGS